MHTTTFEVTFDGDGAVDYVGGRGFTFGRAIPQEYDADGFGSGGDGKPTWGVDFVSGGADRLLDWAFDPALSVREHFDIVGEENPSLWSMTYTCHPYFGVFDSCPERRPAESINYTTALNSILQPIGLRATADQVRGLVGGALKQLLTSNGVAWSSAPAKLAGAMGPPAIPAWQETGIPSPSLGVGGRDYGWDWKLSVGVAPEVVARVLWPTVSQKSAPDDVSPSLREYDTTCPANLQPRGRDHRCS